jgi:hypothetical protein
MAPDEDVRKISDDAMTRLNSLQDAEFNKTFADAQLRVQTAVVAQYGAYSQKGQERPSTAVRPRGTPDVTVFSGIRQASSWRPVDD